MTIWTLRREMRRLERELDAVVKELEAAKAGKVRVKLVEKADGIRALLATYEQIEEQAHTHDLPN